MKYFKDKRKINFVIIITLTSVLSLGVFMQGCNSDFDFENTVEELDIPEEYNDVGKLHNEGLEYIFEEIKAQGIAYTNNPRLKNRPFLENKDKFVKQATLDFCNQHKRLQKNIKICQNVLKDSPSLKSSNMEIFSPDVKQLLKEITSILGQEYKEDKLSRLKAKLDVINQKAATSLSEQDAAIIYSATSTSYYTYQYWKENYKKWYFALNYPEILEKYNNKELNQLRLKNGSEGWITDLFNATENWFLNTTNSVEDWWNENGEQILRADGVGAAYGAGKAFINAGAASLVFGPGGIVTTTVAGAVVGAVEGSALGIITIEIYN